VGNAFAFFPLLIFSPCSAASSFSKLVGLCAVDDDDDDDAAASVAVSESVSFCCVCGNCGECSPSFLCWIDVVSVAVLLVVFSSSVSSL